MIKIGILGTGNIGKRHLQSIGDIKDEKGVFCYDISKKCLDSLDNFITENKVNIKNIDIILNLDKFLNKIDNNTIIIIATTAKGRIDLIKKIIDKKPKAMIIEKPVCQSIAEYEEILKFKKKNSTYVNFPRRCYEFYRDLFNEIQKHSIQKVQINFSEEGIACNGIHLLDLIMWLTQAKKYEIISTKVFKTHESKRKGFFDFSGNIKFKVNEGVICELNNSNKTSVEYIQIITDQKIFNIYENLNKVVKITKDSLNILDIETPFQSKLTSKVIEDMMKVKSNGLLPNLEEAYLSHKILFEFMENNKISDLNIT